MATTTYTEVQQAAIDAGVGQDMIAAAQLMVKAGMEAAALAALKAATAALKKQAADVNHVAQFSALPMRDRAESDTEDYTIPSNGSMLTTINELIAGYAARLSVYNAQHSTSLRIEIIDATDMQPVQIGITSRKRRAAPTDNDFSWESFVKHAISAGVKHVYIPTGLDKGDRLKVEISRAAVKGDAICVNPDPADRAKNKYVTVAQAARYAQTWNPKTQTFDERRWRAFNARKATVLVKDTHIAIDAFYDECEITIALAEESQAA